MRQALEQADVSITWLGAKPETRYRTLVPIARKLARYETDLIHAFLPSVAYHLVLSKLLFRSARPCLFSSGGMTISLPLQKALMKHGIGRYCQKILCNSETVRQFWQEVGVPRSKLSVLPNGHELERFAAPASRVTVRQELNIGNKDKLVLSIGRLVESKCHHDLLWAVSRLKQTEPAVHVVIAGEGDQRGSLYALASKLGLSDRVHLLGTRNDVVDLLNSADVFAFPSILEGLPNAVIEAALAGCPVVAADIEPTRQIITNCQSGILFPPRDVSAFADGLKQVLDDPQYGSSLASEAQRQAERKYDINHIITRLQEIYLDTQSS